MRNLLSQQHRRCLHFILLNQLSFLQVSASIFRQEVSQLVKFDLAYDISPLRASRGKERHTHTINREEKMNKQTSYTSSQSPVEHAITSRGRFAFLLSIRTNVCCAKVKRFFDIANAPTLLREVQDREDEYSDGCVDGQTAEVKLPHLSSARQPQCNWTQNSVLMMERERK